MDKAKRKEIMDFLAKHRPTVERIRIKNDALEAFGPMPNTDRDGWYFLAWADEIEMKGLNCLR